VTVEKGAFISRLSFAGTQLSLLLLEVKSKPDTGSKHNPLPYVAGENESYETAHCSAPQGCPEYLCNVDNIQ
jgi:hypothetical protein